jgi:hypothetical protein
MDRSHEVPNLHPGWDVINLPKAFIGVTACLLGQVDDICTEGIGKKEIVVQEKKIRIDVEESKSDIAAIQGMKSERHYFPQRAAGNCMAIDRLTLTVYK